MAMILAVVLAAGSLQGTAYAAQQMESSQEGISQEDVSQFSEETEEDTEKNENDVQEDGEADAQPSESYFSQEEADDIEPGQADDNIETAVQPAETENSPEDTGASQESAEITQEEMSDPQEEIVDPQESAETPQEEMEDLQENSEVLQESAEASADPQEDLPELVEVELDLEDEILNVTPAMAASVDTRAAQSCETLEETLGYVREQAFSRTETITVLVPESVFLALDLVGFSDLFAHTGDPRGGDYLKSAIWSIGAGYQSQEGMYAVVYHLLYHDSAEEEQEADRETARLVSALGLKDNTKSDYDKIKAIHDYICETVEYDYDTLYGNRDDYPQTYCGYGALVRHLAVCQGYSSMFYRLALEAGIDTRIISSKKMAHAWNIVRLGDLYYLVDCTWDENTNTEEFFLKGKKDFARHENSDDDFHEAAFAERYPLSEYRYGFSLQNLGAAPDYTLLTWNHGTVSTSAKDGRAKVLLFFFEGCSFTEPILESLREKTFSGVDFVYAYMKWDIEAQKRIISEIGKSLPADVPGTYAVCNNNLEALSELEELTGIADPEGYTYSPTIFLINSENQIVLAQHGDPGNLEMIVRDFLEDPSAPEPAGEDFGEPAAMGNCGNSAVWRFYEDGTLRISGDGPLWDNLYSSSLIGWVDEELIKEEDSFALENIRGDFVKNIVIDAGITRLGMGILRSFENLESITFRGPLPDIDQQGLYHGFRIYYPEAEDSWKNADKSIFTSSTKWISLDENGVHHHKWGAWKTIKAATVQAEGRKERSCTECGVKTTAAIPKLDPIPITSAKVTFPDSLVYNGSPQKPVPTVKAGSSTLKAGTDYRITYKNNTHAGTAQAVLTGTGDYAGTLTASFRIGKAAQKLTAKGPSSLSAGKTASVTVSGAKGTKTFSSSNTAVAAVDKNGLITARKVGTAKITVTSSATSDFNKASKTLTINIVPAATASLTADNQAKGIKLTWKKVDGANGYHVYRDSTRIKTITSGGTVTYTDTAANTNGTKYTYKIVAKASTGNSTLSKSLTTYRVAQPAVKTLTNSSSKKMTVTWAKNARATGYQIQYSTDSGFKSGNNSVNVSNVSTVSKVIGSLSKGKTYYVRIRTYKTAGSKNYWSAWSAKKSVKISK